MKTLLLCLLSFALTVAAKAEFYLYTSLSGSASYPFLYATGINNAGEVVGTAFDTASRPVAIRHSGGTMHIYPSPGPAHSTWGNAINASGTIVGLCDRNGSIYHAFSAAPAGSAVDFDGNMSRSSEAKAITDGGYVVGTVGTQSFLGHTSGWIFPLGSTLGATFSVKDINNNLLLTGNGPWGGMTYNAFSGTITYLGYALGTWSNQAAAINDAGTVAGKVGTTGFLYTGGIVSYFGFGISEIAGINAAGDVVGTNTAGHGFVYLRSSGHFLDLNSTVASSVSATWTIVSATGINDHGTICGQARRLATPAEMDTYGTYVYQPYKMSPFKLIFFPLATIAVTR